MSDVSPRILRGSLALSASILFLGSCARPQDRRVINLWRQMRPEDRAVLDRRIEIFERQQPALAVNALYKETEDLRGGLVSAVMARRGPEVIYGPSDVPSCRPAESI